MDINTIRARFKEAEVPLSQRDAWQVQSATVIKHAALERLAAACGVTFDAPTMVRAEREEAVVLVTGRMGDKAEWSLGEALVNVNYRVSGKMAAYVYAMAEKRAKDRVIIKLVGLHGVYSEEEADDFKQERPTADGTDASRRRVESAGGKGVREYMDEDRQDERTAAAVGDALSRIAADLIRNVEIEADLAGLMAMKDEPEFKDALAGLPSDDERNAVRAAWARQAKAFGWKPERRAG